MGSRNSRFIPSASVLSKNSKLGMSNEWLNSNVNRSVDSLCLDLDKDKEVLGNQSIKSDQLNTLLEPDEVTKTAYKLYESEPATERADEKQSEVEGVAEPDDVFSSSSSSPQAAGDTLYRTFKEGLNPADL